MSYAIFRTQKMQSTVINKCQRHNQRENKNYSNKEIDSDKTRLNYDLHNDKNIKYIDKINEKINERYKGKRSVRKDAVLNIECLITSDSDFFNRIGTNETKRYFQEAYEFVKSEFGNENIVYATVHLDESTPHMHLGVTPITSDGRLSAKCWLDGKKKLTELQNRFYEHMTNKNFQLERGISSNETNTKNIKIQDLKKQSLDELNQINKKLEEMKNEFEKTTNVLDRNSLDIFEINSIKYEDVSTLFGKDTENIKIKKRDFEKLKISALKAYEQHNLYATVSKQIETLTKLKDEYKQEKEFYYRKYNGIKHKYDNDMHYSKLNHEEKIKSKDNLIKEFEKFIDKNNLTDEFKSYSEKLKERKIHKKVKSQNINNGIEI